MRISIVTPSFQQVSFLEETILSVAGQTHGDVEHIVVDAGSTDGSKELIEQHEDRLAWWVSETDKGQSDAINKGLEKVTGEVFNWLNSDDILVEGALAHVNQVFENDPLCIACCGKLIHRRVTGDALFDYRTDGTDPSNYLIDHVVSQPATFLRTSAVRAVGGVEENLSYVMDYELWLQLMFRFGPEKVSQIDRPLAVFRIHDESKTSTEHASFVQEMASVLFGICERTGNDDLADALRTGYAIVGNLRPMDGAEETHHELVRQMVFHFLFKWNGTIGSKMQFQMMRAAIRSYDRSPVALKKDMNARRLRLASQLNVSDWNIFRVKRKLIG